MYTLIGRIFGQVRKQTNNSAVKIFSCLFLESKFSVFWPNSAGLISKTIQLFLPQILHRACQRCELHKRSGDFFYLRGSGDILQKLPVIAYRCKTAISTLQFDKKK